MTASEISMAICSVSSRRSSHDLELATSLETSCSNVLLSVVGSRKNSASSANITASTSSASGAEVILGAADDREEQKWHLYISNSTSFI